MFIDLNHLLILTDKLFTYYRLTSAARNTMGVFAHKPSILEFNRIGLLVIRERTFR